MSRYTGPSWKLSRRLGYSLSGTEKEIARRPYAPGQHGQKRKKLSEYGVQMQEKQKVRFTYGVSEKQFKKTYNEAAKMAGKQGVNFLKLLESRLDNVVYRIGFASTRAQARQLVAHGHVTVDGKKVDIASYRVQPGQVVSLKDASKNLVVVKAALEGNFSRKEYVTFDENSMSGTFVRLPERDEFLKDINEQLIVEYYSR